MSGECEECMQHILDCKCERPLFRQYISKEEAEKYFPRTYEKELTNEEITEQG